QPGKIELGLGIHGEPGASIVDTHNSREIVAQLVDALHQKTGPDARLAVMINNLGGVSALEMALLTKELAHSRLSKQIDYLIGPAALVSALDMKGFSLSAISLDETFEKALKASVETAGWQSPVPFREVKAQPHNPIYNRMDVTPSENAAAKQIVTTVTETLISLENRLNALDAKVGDGDTGSTFAEGARDIKNQLDAGQLPLNDTGALLLLIGERLATVMGGSSGVLMSIFFTAAGQKVAEGEPLPQALQVGLQQMQRYGGADLGDRTLIDALQPALDVLAEQGLEGADRAAKQGADDTAQIHKANAGRSSYVNSENLSGVPDPGAVAVAEVFGALIKR
ncbi:MAG TPA: dihydroxyacetone kinase, partial [Atlantibacter hermannii]|nr:dihydroxyacetone kinase [Atlantibacter hermannii]